MSLEIMVADEEPRTVQLMRALATPLGHTVLHFENYSNGGRARRGPTVRCGLRRPAPARVRRAGLAHRIRKSHANHGTPIVMLSSTDYIPSLRKAFGEGADMVIAKPVHADRLRRMLAAMDSPDWKHKRAAARLPLHTEVICTCDNQPHALHSLNISESGMLLQPSLDVAIGSEASLSFKIGEVRASLNLRARITRKEGNERVLPSSLFDLEPEDRNAIRSLRYRPPDGPRGAPRVERTSVPGGSFVPKAEPNDADPTDTSGATILLAPSNRSPSWRSRAHGNRSARPQPMTPRAQPLTPRHKKMEHARKDYVEVL